MDLYGDFLFKFALVRLRDPDQAEDLVQETFLAALKGADRFTGQAAEKSWLVGILKHKIFDFYRQAGREVSFTDLNFYADAEGESFSTRGLGKRSWIDDLGPVEWTANPGAGLDKEKFWRAFHACARKLPKKVSAVFCLREMDGLDCQEICDLLAVSESNLWVMLHRARMALRRCLETNWFEKNTSDQPGGKTNPANYQV